MDLNKDCLYKTVQGKRTASGTVVCEEDAKKLKSDSDTPSVLFDLVADSKENIPETDMPLDMSRGSKSGIANVERKSQSFHASVQVLREKLRNEEAALLLLKKLQRSQLSLAVHGSGLSLGGGSTIRQNRVISNNVFATTQSVTAGRMIARQPIISHVAPQNLSVHAGQQEVSHQVPVAHKQYLVNGTALLKESNIRPQPPRPSAAPQRTHEQTLAQRQALAKLAIHRQLEATLLQLPKPKFTPEKMPFIPTVGVYADFVALVGMEDAITCILNEEAATAPADAVEQLQPLQCERCKTDFTPQWKPEQQGAKTVICEHCASKSRKEAFRQEHTALLMAAFRQAQQQERQIEIGGAVA